jgi:hypothetical protein
MIICCRRCAGAGSGSGSSVRRGGAYACVGATAGTLLQSVRPHPNDDIIPLFITL